MSVASALRTNRAHAAWAEALLDRSGATPAGLVAWNGSDVARRFGVYRNNVLVSLAAVLADGFPVVRQLVGDVFFQAMAQAYLRDDPPRSPVMTEYGDGFADWLSGFEPAAGLPYLADLARLERARVRAYHAADADPLPDDALAQALAEPERLPALRLQPHPSLAVLRSAHAVVSLWAAHQAGDDLAVGEAVAALELDRPEAAVVLRGHDDEVLVLPLPAPDAAFVDALRAGLSLGEALAAAPGADVGAALALLVRQRALVRLAADGEPA
jgi:hypothetical protein